MALLDEARCEDYSSPATRRTQPGM